MQFDDCSPTTRSRLSFCYLGPRDARLIAPALIALVIACGDGLGPGEKEGTGTVTASGAVSTSGNGVAMFQSVTNGNINLFQLFIAPQTGTTSTWAVQIVSTSGRPPAGTYQLSPLSGNGPDPTATFSFASGGSMQMFNSTSGELIITSSSPTSVRGTYNFTGTSTSGGGSTVTAQGAFNAQCAPGFGCQ